MNRTDLEALSVEELRALVAQAKEQKLKLKRVRCMKPSQPDFDPRTMEQAHQEYLEKTGTSDNTITFSIGE